MSAPLAQGDPALSPCAFVLFGSTGDLTRRKIMPALYSLAQQNLLPSSFAIIAFARRDKDDNSYRDDVKSAILEFSPSLKPEGVVWDNFSKSIYYLRANLDDAEGYRLLCDRLNEMDIELGLKGNRLFYLATPPENFNEIIENLGRVGLNRTVTDHSWTRLIVEKPFGYDLKSARELNHQLELRFKEEQIYRVDHYLGKETVQNILVLRFANQIFEPLFNKNYVDNVQITVTETIGVEGRGNYFEKSGITRDIVQNHALQVLTLIAMEPPISLEADAIRDEKVKTLRSIRPFSPEDVANLTVRGQYGHGFTMAGDKQEPVPGYREEDGVDPRSITETFAAFNFSLDNWRWSGVPFYVKAGKRMPCRATEVQIQFKSVPDVLFARILGKPLCPNRLLLRIQPDEGASIEVCSKVPGQDLDIRSVLMNFTYGESFDVPIRDAYELLLMNAVRGDASLFARNDEVEAAWEVMTPILDAWEHTLCPVFPNYAAGSWGPDAADKLLSSGVNWCLPE